MVVVVAVTSQQWQWLCYVIVALWHGSYVTAMAVVVLYCGGFVVWQLWWHLHGLTVVVVAVMSQWQQWLCHIVVAAWHGGCGRLCGLMVVVVVMSYYGGYMA